MFAKPILLSVLMALSMTAAAQSSTRSAGQAGAEFGEELLEAGKKAAEYDPEGGTRASGTINVEGAGAIDLNDLAPGADRKEIERLGRIQAGSAASVAEGEAAFNRDVNANGGNGDALRAFTQSAAQAQRGRALVDAETLVSSQSAIDSAASGNTEAFGQCEVVTESRAGDVLITTRQEERTCSVGSQSETCGRVLAVDVVPGPRVNKEIGREAFTVASEGSISVTTIDPSELADGQEFRLLVLSNNLDVRAVLMTPPSASNGFTAEVNITRIGSSTCGIRCNSVSGEVTVLASFDGPPTVTAQAESIGVCELEGSENSCSVAWECADSSPRTVNGVRITEALLEQQGVEPLAPGLPRMCWAARPVFTCAICSVEEGGFSNCENAVIRGPVGNTCSALENDSSCRLGGETCLVYDVDGTTCLEKARSYTCAEEVRTVVTETVSYNTCDVPAVCVGDGCRAADKLVPASQGNAMHRAAANLAVMDTIINDRQSRPGGGAGPGPGPGPGGPNPGVGIIEQQSVKSRAAGTSSVGGSAGQGSQGEEWGFDAPDQGYDPNDPEQLRNLDGVSSAILDEIRLFSGKAGTCKKGWGGLVQCCSKTRTDGPKRYWSIFQRLSKERQAAMLSSAGGDNRSWSEILASGGEISLDSLRAGFMNNADNLQGAGSGGQAKDTAAIHEAFMASARSEIKPSLKPSWICADKEFDLAVQRELGMCSYAGTYCSRKVLGVCLQRKEAYCCYNSPMSRMLRASVDGGTLNHGSPKRPDCAGIPIDRIDEIDWDAIPWDELIGRMSEGEALATDEERANAVERYTGSGMSYGGEGRVNAVDRTQERVGEIAGAGARDAIQADARRQYAQVPVIEGRGAGDVAFSPAFATLRPGLPGVLTLSRRGTGPASVTVSLVQGSAQTAGFYSQRVTLPADGGTVNVRLDVRDAQPGEEWVFEISDAQGVTIGAAPTTTLRYGGQ